MFSNSPGRVLVGARQPLVMVGPVLLPPKVPLPLGFVLVGARAWGLLTPLHSPRGVAVALGWEQGQGRAVLPSQAQTSEHGPCHGWAPAETCQSCCDGWPWEWEPSRSGEQELQEARPPLLHPLPHQNRRQAPAWPGERCHCCLRVRGSVLAYPCTEVNHGAVDFPALPLSDKHGTGGLHGGHGLHRTVTPTLPGSSWPLHHG